MKDILSPGDGYLDTARNGRRMTHFLLIILIFYAIYDIGILLGFVAYVPLGKLLASLFSGDVPGPLVVLSPLIRNIAVYVWPYLLLWAWLWLYERRSLASAGLRTNGVGRGIVQFLCGVAAALALAAGWLAVQVATDHLAFEGWMSTGQASLVLFGPLLVTAFLGRAFQIGIEEVLFRGWVLQDVGARYGPWVGVLFSSAFFSASHFLSPLALFGFGNIHDPWPPLLIINIFLWAVFAALWTLYGRSIWAAIGFHAAALWSVSVVFGLGGSSVGIIDLRLVDPSWLTGGTGFAGLFEGLPATALLAVAVAVMLVLLRRRAARESSVGGGAPESGVERSPLA